MIFLVGINSIIGLVVACWSLLVYATREQGIVSISVADINFRVVIIVSLSLLVTKSFLVGITGNLTSSFENTLLFFLFLITFVLLTTFGFFQLRNLWVRRAVLLTEIRRPVLFLSARILNWIWVRVAVVFMVWAAHYNPVLILVPLGLIFFSIFTSLIFFSF